jgi:peptidoglycan/xylan/chitin deacetylase (PgdA/CDA1 family)
MTTTVAVTFDNLGEAAELERGQWPEGEPLGRHFSVCEALPRLLEALREAGLHATFFVEGLNAERWGAIVTTGWAESDVRPALRDMLRRRCDQIRAFAAMFLREAIARGEIEPEVDVEELSLALAMLMDGVIGHQAEMGDRFDPDLVQRSVIALVGRTLRR